MFKVFPEALRQKYGKVAFATDNAVSHKSRLIRKYLKSTGGDVVLICLPPYTPQINPIEIQWRMIKARLADRVCVGGGRRDGRYRIQIAASEAFAEQEIALALRDSVADSVRTYLSGASDVHVYAENGRTYATVTSSNEGPHLLDITNLTDIGELHLASTQGINVYYSANNNFNPGEGPEGTESDQQQACDIPAIVRQYDADGSCKIEQSEWLVAIADYTADPPKLTTPQIQQIAAHRG